MKRYWIVFTAVVVCVCLGVYIVMPNNAIPGEATSDAENLNGTSGNAYSSDSGLNSDVEENSVNEPSSVFASITIPSTNDQTLDIDNETTGLSAGSQDEPGSSEELSTSPALTLWRPSEPVTAPAKKNSAELAVLERVLFTFGFEYDKEQNIFYSSVEPWQKNFGFTEIYDFFAQFGAMIYHTERFKFNYNGKDWMIQTWKGRYGITTGCEIGIYYKDVTQPAEVYLCAEEEDFVAMDFFVYKHGEPYMFRGPEKHWWLTGFKLGDIYYGEDLYMIMTFYLEDKGMADAFEASVAGEGFVKNIQESRGYIRDGNTVQIYW